MIENVLGMLAKVIATGSDHDALVSCLDACSPDLLLATELTRSDIQLCWTLHGREPPAAVLDQFAPATVDHEPPPSDWEGLTRWAFARASLAVPGEHALEGRDEDLLRGAALALLESDYVRAGALLRWMALQPRSPDCAEAFRGALAMLLHTVHRPEIADRARAAWQASAALAIARTTTASGASSRPTVAPRACCSEPALRDRLLQRGLAWLRAHRADFAIGAGLGVTDELLAVKAVAELAVVADLMMDGPHAGLGRELLEYAWVQLEQGARLRRHVERLPALSVLATVYVPFHRAGLRDAALEDLFQRHADAAPKTAAPLMASTLQRLGLSVSLPTEPDALGAARPPWQLRRADVYDVTHAILAFTDVGREPLRVGTAYVQRWYEVWLREFHAAGDHDLLAELVLAGHCARVGCAPAWTWRALADVQRDDGTVPFATTAAVASLGVGDYHSTLMAVAAALACHD